ncbi:hypothetical protein WL40_05045 [Burkholderia ubonensis]|uniref:hypothetical protein n=1 Tax=Burkholderia ubonensis TaxID=101571 RepID=UPI00075617BA|nr:hypothetical protein [Burkholderia ubonensis]KVH81810.1 hypothetical protein WJ41_27370 [Burkholderia ubonensis]KVM17006.1 hypothetical protein WJ52_13015 [Burkholderia ubonensis]KVM18806.1 hypothetical protein WJ51_07070 [Burkholderia ubonensis]KVM42258.1 hypothetical protein WJ56_30720 [Burkholderia ubonensis]KVN96827.1 hypothetical protein WJ69_02085 [Burkholderia ubonensis]
METKDKNPPKNAASGATPDAAAAVNPPPQPPIAAPAPEAILQSIEKERDALPAQAREYLESHLIANVSHALNERLFQEVHTFKPITLTFANLRANSKAFLTLQADQEAIWSDGGAGDRLVGLSLASRVDPVLYVRNFLVNAREMYVQTYQDMQEIQVSLYVRTEQHDVRGRVDLPPGASVTFQSSADRSTVIGISSFTIELG